jgi:hypothetical protein
MPAALVAGAACDVALATMKTAASATTGTAALAAMNTDQVSARR